MTARNDDIERIAKRARATTVKAAGEAQEAVESAVDETREAAKQVFERIKEIRKKAVKPVKDDAPPVTAARETRRSAAALTTGRQHP